MLQPKTQCSNLQRVITSKLLKTDLCISKRDHRNIHVSVQTSVYKMTCIFMNLQPKLKFCNEMNSLPHNPNF